MRHREGEVSFLGKKFFKNFFFRNFFPKKRNLSLPLCLIVSAYLGYVLLYILEDICVICTSTYAVNIGLIMVCQKRLKAINSAGQKKKN